MCSRLYMHIFFFYFGKGGFACLQTPFNVNASIARLNTICSCILRGQRERERGNETKIITRTSTLWKEGFLFSCKKHINKEVDRDLKGTASIYFKSRNKIERWPLRTERVPLYKQSQTRGEYFWDCWPCGIAVGLPTIHSVPNATDVNNATGSDGRGHGSIYLFLYYPDIGRKFQKK